MSTAVLIQSPPISTRQLGLAVHRRRPLMFRTKEAVRLAVTGVATGTACGGCQPLGSLVEQYAAAKGA